MTSAVEFHAAKTISVKPRTGNTAELLGKKGLPGEVAKFEKEIGKYSGSKDLEISLSPAVEAALRQAAQESTAGGATGWKFSEIFEQRLDGKERKTLKKRQKAVEKAVNDATLLATVKSGDVAVGTEITLAELKAVRPAGTTDPALVTELDNIAAALNKRDANKPSKDGVWTVDKTAGAEKLVKAKESTVDRKAKAGKFKIDNSNKDLAEIAFSDAAKVLKGDQRNIVALAAGIAEQSNLSEKQVEKILEQLAKDPAAFKDVIEANGDTIRGIVGGRAGEIATVNTTALTKAVQGIVENGTELASLEHGAELALSLKKGQTVDSVIAEAAKHGLELEKVSDTAVRRAAKPEILPEAAQLTPAETHATTNYLQWAGTIAGALLGAAGLYTARQAKQAATDQSQASNQAMQQVVQQILMPMAAQLQQLQADLQSLQSAASDNDETISLLIQTAGKLVNDISQYTAIQPRAYASAGKQSGGTRFGSDEHQMHSSFHADPAVADAAPADAVVASTDGNDLSPDQLAANAQANKAEAQRILEQLNGIGDIPAPVAAPAPVPVVTATAPPIGLATPTSETSSVTAPSYVDIPIDIPSSTVKVHGGNFPASYKIYAPTDIPIKGDGNIVHPSNPSLTAFFGDE